MPKSAVFGAHGGIILGKFARGDGLIANARAREAKAPRVRRKKVTVPRGPVFACPAPRASPPRSTRRAHRGRRARANRPRRFYADSHLARATPPTTSAEQSRCAPRCSTGRSCLPALLCRSPRAHPARDFPGAIHPAATRRPRRRAGRRTRRLCDAQSRRAGRARPGSPRASRNPPPSHSGYRRPSNPLGSGYSGLDHPEYG